MSRWSLCSLGPKATGLPQCPHGVPPGDLQRGQGPSSPGTKPQSFPGPKPSLAVGILQRSTQDRAGHGEMPQEFTCCWPGCFKLHLNSRPESAHARPSLSFEAHLALLPQSLMDAQNLRIEELLQKVKQQQYKLDKQNLQIKSLQTLLPAAALNHGVSPDPGPRAYLDLPEGCHQLFLAGQQSSGVFQVQPAGSQPFKVYCDMTAEGGWTVIQRRMDGSVDFDQLWDAYKNGFGDLRGDFWLGLEKIHHLVQEGKYSLLIELEDWEGNSQVVQFVFSLGGESTAYTLNLLGPLSGELENAIGEFRQLPFSTRDRDHDLKADTNCAKHLSGGWWFSTCGHANLNGKYFRSIPRQRHERKQGIFWKTWKGRYYPLKSTIMKIQPAALEAET
uniref:Angiopoietin like 4 n=1 Tax=Cyanistes caeruleus TaxID=156563 RepID=A0A8C0ZJK9_CYACU